MVDGIENFYRDKINMLRERIETEKFERKIAQMAQMEALSRMKRELDLSKKKRNWEVPAPSEVRGLKVRLLELKFEQTRAWDCPSLQEVINSKIK